MVGASATGVQLAEEIRRSGRPVVLSVGEHVRLPRTYRGRDVLWWMDASGVWDQRYDEIDDIVRARQADDPSIEQGAWVTDLKEADWKFVARQCAQLIEKRSKDLQLAVWLAEAEARTSGLGGLADSLVLIAAL